MSPSPSAPAAANPAPLTTPSPKAPPVTSGLFLPPKGPPAILPPPFPSSSPTTGDPTPSSYPGDDAAAPTWSDASADSGETTDPPPGPSDTPSTGSNPGRITKAGLRAVVGQAVKTVTNAAASLATTPTEQEFGLWRADDEDIEGIAAPAAAIAWRRVPAAARDTDTVDLIGLALAVTAYVAKNLRRRAHLRAAIATGEITPAAGPDTPADTP